VVGQTRLQESAWLAQLAKQASLLASANRSHSLREAGPAIAVPINTKDNATPNRGFIWNLRYRCRSKAHSNPRAIMHAGGVHSPRRFQPC
jgi:hypothetical protein